RLAHRYHARGTAGRAPCDRAVRAARWRNSLAPLRLAEGRKSPAGDRCRRSARHQPGGRRPRALAARPQPFDRQRRAAPLHPHAAPSLASSPKGRAVIARIVTLSTTLAAAVVVLMTMGPKPAPSLVWNASSSVPVGLYRVRPAGK